MALNLLTRGKNDAATAVPSEPSAFQAAATDQTARQASAGTIYEWPDPRKPGALLIPRSVLHQNAEKKTTTQMAALVLGSGVVAVALAAWGFLGVHSAQSNLGAATAAQVAAQAQVDKLKPIADYYDSLVGRTTAAGQLLHVDTKHDTVFADVLAAFPGGSSLTAYQTAFGSPCASEPNPYGTAPDIGCITATGTAPDQQTVAQIVKTLNSSKDGFIDNAFVNSTTKSAASNGYDFQFTVNYSINALSNRYASLSALSVVQAAPPTSGTPAAGQPSARTSSAPNGTVSAPTAATSGSHQ